MNTKIQKVLVRVAGFQFGADEEESIEHIIPGSMYKTDDYYYVKYEEVLEGFQEKSDVLLKFRPGHVEMTKKGLVCAHMVFANNESSQTDYKTPYGNLLLSIRGKKVTVTESKDGFALYAAYSLDVNYKYISDNEIHIRIQYT